MVEGIATAHLVGHSTDGAIGQTIAKDYPDRLRSLVLSATWPGQAPYFRRLFESRRQTLVDSGVEAYLRASALMLAPPWWVSANDVALAESHKASVAAAAPVEVMVSRIDAIMAFDRRARLGEIRVPTLVIVANDDMVNPRFYSDELASKIPGARYVVLDGVAISCLRSRRGLTTRRCPRSCARAEERERGVTCRIMRFRSAPTDAAAPLDSDGDCVRSIQMMKSQAGAGPVEGD